MSLCANLNNYTTVTWDQIFITLLMHSRTWNQSFGVWDIPGLTEKTWWYVRSIHMWWLDDEHFPYCCIEPQSHINICEEIDDNSATREPTLIKICSKLLDANLSQGRISPLDSLHLCPSSEHLGRWLWSKVERKDPSGPSRMVHTVYHN